MSVFAGKIRLPFEPKMAVAMDAVQQTQTPEAIRPTLGTLAALRYTPARIAYNLKLSSAPTTGAATVRIFAGATEIASSSVAIVGATEIGGSFDVDVSEVKGQTKLSAAVDVTSAADAGITATLDAFLDVDLPVVNSGC